MSDGNLVNLPMTNVCVYMCNDVQMKLWVFLVQGPKCSCQLNVHYIHGFYKRWLSATDSAPTL